MRYFRKPAQAADPAPVVSDPLELLAAYLLSAFDDGDAAALGLGSGDDKGLAAAGTGTPEDAAPDGGNIGPPDENEEPDALEATFLVFEDREDLREAVLAWREIVADPEAKELADAIRAQAASFYRFAGALSQGATP